MPKNQTPKTIPTRIQNNQLLTGPLDQVLRNVGAAPGTAAKIASRGSVTGSSASVLAGMSPKDKTKVLSVMLTGNEKPQR